MPLKSSPEYCTGRKVTPSCAQIKRISSMSNPPGAPPSIRSNGGSGKADATINVSGLSVSAMGCSVLLLARHIGGARAATSRNRHLRASISLAQHQRADDREVDGAGADAGGERRRI